jgi:hypothetical protein
MRNPIRFFLYVLPIVMVPAFLAFNVVSSGGKAGQAGSPGEGTCLQCHASFALNSGPGGISFSCEALENANWEFWPDSLYNISITLNHAGASMFGFGVEALNGQNANGGTLVVTQPQSSQLMNATVGGTTRTNLVHKSNGGSGNNAFTLSFGWRSPITDTAVTFYVVSNAVNRDGTTNGDYVYAITKKVRNVNQPSQINSPKLASVMVYPNPVHQTLTVNLPQHAIGQLIKIFNQAGQLVEIALDQQLDVSQYPTGYYTVIVTDMGHTPLAKSSFIKL